MIYLKNTLVLYKPVVAGEKWGMLLESEDTSCVTLGWTCPFPGSSEFLSCKVKELD